MDPSIEQARSHYREIFRFVRRRASSSTAEDVTQDVFAAAARALARSASHSPPSLAWLYTVARRRLIDEARARRIVVVPLDALPEAAAPERYGPHVARTFDRALAKLTDAQRQVVLQRLLEGRSFAEIAAREGATEEACRMRFMRGLERLRAEFEREGLTP